MRNGSHHSETTREHLAEKSREAWKTGKLNAVTNPTFKKGHPTWNKGISIHLSPKSEWHEGDVAGSKHPFWKGGVTNSEKDCALLWNGANKRVRRPKMIYESHFGKLKHGYVIYHKDGNNKNDGINNLVAISRAELVKINNKK